MNTFREQFRKTLVTTGLLDLLFQDNDKDYIIWLENKLIECMNKKEH